MAVPSLGRMSLGTGPFGKQPADRRGAAEAAVAAAFDGGLRHFDTAPFYGLGQAERWLGAALAGRERSSFVVSTKVGRSPVDLAGNQRAEFDFSRDSVLRSFEESLARLGLDAVDILLIHDPDDHWAEAVDQTYPVLHELREQGVVRAIGVGMNQWHMPARFIAETDVDVVLLAGRYSLLDRSAGEEFLPLCQERGIGVIIAGVFNSGVLATDEPAGTYFYAPAPAAIIDRAQRMAAVCARHGVSLPQAALHFSRRHPAITGLLVGSSTPEEVRRNLALVDQPVPDELWAELAEV